MLSLLISSCTDDLHNFSPTGDAIGTIRQSSGRNGNVLDSTIAGVPTLIGSEWVYADSNYVSLRGWRRDTSTVRLLSLDENSVKVVTCTYTRQIFHRTEVDTYRVYIHADTLYGGGYWGDGLFGQSYLYLFPLVIGRQWRNPLHHIDTNYVIRKEITAVPAGTFNSFVIRNHAIEPGSGTTESQRWYSPEVGIVRISGQVFTLETYFEWHSDLIRYHLGPRGRWVPGN